MSEEQTVRQEVEERLLARLCEGPDAEAAEELLRLVYRDLRRIAHAKLRHASPVDTLRTTDLVGRTYERLFAAPNFVCSDREHFLSRAASAMRCILIDTARRKASGVSLPRDRRVPLEGLTEAFEARVGDLEALEVALERLEAIEPRAAKVVELRFFGDCSVEESADELGVSRRTIEREWTFAKAFLKKEIAG